MRQRVSAEFPPELDDRRAEPLHGHAPTAELRQEARLDHLAPGDRVAAGRFRAQDWGIELPAALIPVQPATSGAGVQPDQTIHVRVGVDRTIKEGLGHIVDHGILQ